MSVTSTGDAAAFASLAALVQRFEHGATRGAHNAGAIVVRHTKSEIVHGSKSGRLYPRKGGKAHQASAPGEWSANDTGELMKSIDHTVHGPTRLTVHSDAPHAKYQEFGTAKMAARPNIRMSAEATFSLVESELGRTIHRELLRR
jgi:HK97 gp10 family phage protein